MWIIKIIKIKCFYPPRILDEHWCIYSCLQIPPRENWFQYVRRVYTTANNFPYITALHISIYLSSMSIPHLSINLPSIYLSIWTGSIFKPCCLRQILDNGEITRLLYSSLYIHLHLVYNTERRNWGILLSRGIELVMGLKIDHSWY